MARVGRGWVVVGLVLVVAGGTFAVLVRGGDPETLSALGTFVAILGAGMILRTIGPSR